MRYFNIFIMKNTITACLVLLLLLATTLKAITDSDRKIKARTCPNAPSLNSTSLNGPNRIDVSEIEQGVCTRGTQRTFFRGDLNVKIRGHSPTNLLRGKSDRIPGAQANLTDIERRARDDFVMLFHQHKDKIKPRGKVLDRFAAELDTFFFSGLITSGRRPTLLPIETVWNADLIENDRGHVGATRMQKHFGVAHIQMRLSLSRRTGPGTSINPEPLPLIEILATMVHEMAHAYISAVGCHCSTCVRQVHHSVGHTGHRKAWLRIYEHMQSVLKGWNPAFDFSVSKQDGIGMREDQVMWRVLGHKRMREELEKLEKSWFVQN